MIKHAVFVLWPKFKINTFCLSLVVTANINVVYHVSIVVCFMKKLFALNFLSAYMYVTI